jgi:hypothetical protein
MTTLALLVVMLAAMVQGTWYIAGACALLALGCAVLDQR